jgi:hypothetical protein
MTAEERDRKRERDREWVRNARARAKGEDVPTKPKRRTVRAGRAVIRFGVEMPDLPGAACVGEDPELWFSDDPGERDLAVRICRGCPVRTGCLEFANRNRTRHGVWGGEDLEAPKRKDSAA